MRAHARRHAERIRVAAPPTKDIGVLSYPFYHNNSPAYTSTRVLTFARRSDYVGWKVPVQLRSPLRSHRPPPSFSLSPRSPSSRAASAAPPPAAFASRSPSASTAVKQSSLLHLWPFELNLLTVALFLMAHFLPRNCYLNSFRATCVWYVERAATSARFARSLSLVRDIFTRFGESLPLSVYWLFFFLFFYFIDTYISKKKLKVLGKRCNLNKEGKHRKARVRRQRTDMVIYRLRLRSDINSCVWVFVYPIDRTRVPNALPSGLVIVGDTLNSVWITLVFHLWLRSPNLRRTAKMRKHAQYATWLHVWGTGDQKCFVLHKTTSILRDQDVPR